MRKHRGYLLHDPLCIPTPFGSRVEIHRLDDTVEGYRFQGIDANGRQLLRHPDGRDVFHVFTVPFKWVRVESPQSPDTGLELVVPMRRT